MKQRIYQLNNLFGDADCEKLLLVTLTCFRGMLKKYLEKNLIPTVLDELDILKYKFKERLSELLKKRPATDTTGSRPAKIPRSAASASRSGSGGTVKKDGKIENGQDLVDAFNHIYEVFDRDEVFDRNERIDILEHIFNVEMYDMTKIPSQKIKTESELSGISKGIDGYTTPRKNTVTPRKNTLISAYGGNKKKSTKKKRTPKKKSSKKKRTPKKKKSIKKKPQKKSIKKSTKKNRTPKKKRIPKKKKSIKKKPQKKSRKKSIKKSFKKRGKKSLKK